MQPYNPLEKANLGKSVADSLLKQTPVPLNALKSFDGAGIYAIYYKGAHEDYLRLKNWNSEGDGFNLPIYVGKAIPEGGRKGTGNTKRSRKPVTLYARLNDHRKSIVQATNLDINDFWCRYLVVDDIWIPLGESLLIGRYRPIWNSLLEGFGNHAPGKGRKDGARPLWDTLHPGRTWANKLPPSNSSVDQIKHHVVQYWDAYEAVGIADSPLNPDEGAS